MCIRDSVNSLQKQYRLSDLLAGRGGGSLGTALTVALDRRYHLLEAAQQKELFTLWKLVEELQHLTPVLGQSGGGRFFCFLASEEVFYRTTQILANAA